jgi:predicted DNA binding CopG/RHH family protein
MKRVTVYLSEHQVTAVQELSHETGLKWAEVLRRLLDEALAERQKEHPRHEHPKIKEA